MHHGFRRKRGLNESRATCASEHLETLSLVWEDATDEERKALLYHAIEKVVVDTVTGEIVEIVPKTHFVPLFKLGRKHG